MFYSECMRADTGSSRVDPLSTPSGGVPFKWSLNPYMGCVHRCPFCYVCHLTAIQRSQA
jgi:DNA repair photolyase